MKPLIIVLVFGFLSVYAFPQANEKLIIRFKVSDSKNFPVDNAKIEISSIERNSVGVCQRENTGEYACELNIDGGFLLEIEAEGFSIIRQTFNNVQHFEQGIVFRLFPPPLTEEVVVTANRTESRIGETAASVVSLSQEEIKSSAAPTIDDVLRQVPGFSLFRRSGSRNANPTTQGVSLRGVGASGAGRSLVLFDEVPLNDAFGGWTQWSRISPIAVERIEVLRGGASSLYGNNSLSGTVNIIPRRVQEKYVFSAEIFGGSQRTSSASTFFGFKLNDWSADFVAANFQTRGYIPIERSARGLADDFAGSRNSNLSARIARDFNETTTVFFKTSYFGEARSNGTNLQNNRTHIRHFVLGGEFLFNNLKSKIQNPKLAFRVFSGTQVFDQTFSAVSDDRNNENLVRFQRVPAQTFGFSTQFSTVFKENQTFVFGVEAKEVRGASDETGFFNNRATSQTGAGGRERTFSIFLQDFARINSKIILTGSVRFDYWKNFRALSSTRSLSTNLINTTDFPDRNESAFSPQGSILFQATENLSFHFLASKSFRAPTLNELYRGFRVGNVVTNPNENLHAEKAGNFETGVSFNFKDFYLRGNFFYTEISDPIANVTLSITPNLITRQRQNIGKTRASGVEIEAEKRWRDFNFSVGYLLSDSRILEFPANEDLEGLRVPLVSKHQFTFQTLYANRKGWTFSLQGRASSAQFDDDLNQFRLEPFFQLDAFAAKSFYKNLQFFVGVENIFNSRYSIGKTPIRSVSSPINGRIGLRWN
ncbi:MAG: TonB-dependent receptor [Pyrinomonadaceae bacterium]|nr:TonB-dependent receptor [Pyrinomonadaceae bacterium]